MLDKNTLNLYYAPTLSQLSYPNKEYVKEEF